MWNPSGKDYDGPVAAELNWFCKDGLVLKAPDGKEISYQRVHTEAKARNYNIGGRRGIVFDAHVPALGFAVYRTLVGESSLCCDSRESGGAVLQEAVLENDKIRAAFDKDGFLCSLFDKENGYEALNGPVRFPIWRDERDSWGGIQGRPFEPSGEFLKPEKIELVEEGTKRRIIRATYRLEGTVLRQDYILYHDACQIEVVNHLFWDREWHMLKMELPLGIETPEVYREAAYCTACTPVKDGQEYSMHRFVDITREKQEGLYLANDGKYAFSTEQGRLCIPIARSAIFAQGNGKNWYNPIEGYEYTDLGKQKFTFVLRPHGKALCSKERYRMAESAAGPVMVMTDCWHDGIRKEAAWSGMKVSESNVELGCVKAAEDGEGLIVRLFETEGKKTSGRLKIGGHEVDYTIEPFEILTLSVSEDGKTAVLNLLEERHDGTQ